MGHVFASSRPEMMVALNTGSGGEERDGGKSARLDELRELTRFGGLAFFSEPQK